MHVKELVVSKTIKIPVPGVQYSNQESSCSMTVTVDEGEDPAKVFERAGEEIKRQVEAGLDADAPAWLRGR